MEVPFCDVIVTCYHSTQQQVAFGRATQANSLMTGDRDFTQARKLVTTTIVSVSQFKTLVCDPSL
jgi:hypothetical protein